MDTPIREGIKLITSNAPIDHWTIQTTKTDITIVHKDDHDIVLVHFPMNALDTVVMLLEALQAQMR
jgi:hypothetical protein